MLKHRYIVIVFLLVLLVLILLNVKYSIHWTAYLFLPLIFFSLEFYGSYFIHSDFHLPAICKGIATDRSIALTFDDGPAAQTEKLLNVLNEFGIKATFFCIGNRIKGREELLKKIDSEGHLIGNHSFSHNFWFDLKTKSSFKKDLLLANESVRQVTGRSPLYFRPPYGVTTPALARAVKKLGYTTVGWNIRSLDTSIDNHLQVLSRIKQRLVPGSIILLHDTTKDIDLLVRELLVYLREINYSVVPLDTLIQKKPYA